ncbi:phosphopantetheine-binding protein [Burkholderia multivorans]|uniref:phosphopantetheine-binding protein n=1 Tax=Burkholderia multivorans TaxID=87883 RepID=UPI000D402599|nr:phosphopantetheine-binding protein [Burkholderia multivorans]MBR8017331.1 phosphopantetheine-binding protein [Burkholderia multivorans]MBU9435102.1 phosphopantetheine-binding protein [Burkholderia multivorans]MEB2512704.1 phosphopantetheine-binding protein [Burkholderia multivorans]MEB2522272.1 phosphopantetheine-binding protein [Burkholderia multivorans]MEB2576832.1 phosphopantetheine-binding protein [Burkholderia multivorans]
MTATPTPTTSGLTRERFLADVASAARVDVSAMSDGLAPFEAGLDSLRLLVLIDRWRKLGVELGFGELAERRTLGDWWALIEARERGRT